MAVKDDNNRLHRCIFCDSRHLKVEERKNGLIQGYSLVCKKCYSAGPITYDLNSAVQGYKLNFRLKKKKENDK